MRSNSWLGVLVLAAFSLGTAACPEKSDDDGSKKETKKKKKKSDDETDETDEEEGSAAPTASAAPTSEAPKPTETAPAPAPTPTPTQTAPAAPAARSPKPADADWDTPTATTATIVGGTPIGCEAKEIKEWVRVVCKGADATRGTPSAVIIDEGAVENETFATATQGTATLIYSYIEGRNVKATFAWTKEKRGYTAEWVQGQAKPSSRGVFNPTAEKLEDTTTNAFAIECRSDSACGAGRKCCAGIGAHCRTACTGNTARQVCTSDAECRRELPSVKNPVCRLAGSSGLRTCQAGPVEPKPIERDPKERTPRDPKRDEKTGRDKVRTPR
ncbi:MAG: hypothetical protein JNK04_17670 [Myxococcales bacterium]|nr:hypothetical protein [Myxococcales bacterium]